jgi:hypothetical protein
MAKTALLILMGMEIQANETASPITSRSPEILKSCLYQVRYALMDNPMARCYTPYYQLLAGTCQLAF